MSTFFERIEAANEYKELLADTEERLDKLDQQLAEVKERLDQL